jgi:hypothetical protein
MLEDENHRRDFKTIIFAYAKSFSYFNINRTAISGTAKGYGCNDP